MTLRRATSRPLEILLVEDNPADARLTQQALEDAEFHVSVTWAEDGEEAMAMLRNEGDYARLPRPDLILLDLNLPGKDGREVLSEIKADFDLKSIPVVVLTTSQAEQDLQHSYNMHANSYITKPVGAKPFNDLIRETLNYWVNIVQLPPK